MKKGWLHGLTPSQPTYCVKQNWLRYRVRVTNTTKNNVERTFISPVFWRPHKN